MSEYASCPNLLQNPVVQVVQTMRMYGTACYAIVLWDYILTFKKEYDVVWKGEWRPLTRVPIKVIFLALRYYTIFVYPVPLALFDGNWSAEFCSSHYLLNAALPLPMIFFANAILLIRCWAIWERNTYVMVFGVFILICSITSQYLGMLGVQAIPLPPEIGNFACIGTAKEGAIGRLSDMFWIGPLGVDLITTLLTFVRVWSYRRRGTTSGVLKQFWRDGMFYYILISSANLLNLVFFLLPNHSLNPINAFFAETMSSLLAQRLVLHALPYSQDNDRNSTSTKASPTKPRFPFPSVLDSKMDHRDLQIASVNDAEMGHATFGDAHLNTQIRVNVNTRVHEDYEGSSEKSDQPSFRPSPKDRYSPYAL